MGIKVKALGLWMVPLLSVAALAATGGDLRVVEAVQKGDQEAVRSLLKEHADVNARQADGATALAWAAHWDDLESADLLIRAGANLNAANDYGVTPLSLACTNGNAAMVEKLLKAGADVKAVRGTGETALMRCARTGKVDAVKSLLARGADVNAEENREEQTALMWAVAEKNPEVARVLLEHGADVHARSRGGFTPLLFAARSGDLDSARMLLEAGADVNEAAADGMTPILVASHSGHEALSIFLLEKGANPNVADDNGITPMHYAVLRGISILGNVRAQSPESRSYFFRPNMRELVKALLAHGANPNARMVEDPQLIAHQAPIFLGGATPFMLAVSTGDLSVMRLMSAGGADPRLAMTDNTTLLMAAAGRGVRNARAEGAERIALEAVKLVVELGADVNAADEDGQTALHIAAQSGSNLIIQFLVDHGAKMDVTDRFGQTPFSIAEGVIPESLLGLDVSLRVRDKSPFAAYKGTMNLLRKLGGEVPLTGPVGGRR